MLRRTGVFPKSVNGQVAPYKAIFPSFFVLAGRVCAEGYQARARSVRQGDSLSRRLPSTRPQPADGNMSILSKA